MRLAEWGPDLPRSDNTRAELVGTPAPRDTFRSGKGSSIVTTPCLVALISALGVCACSGSGSPLLPSGHLAFGEWGGDHVDVVASASSTSVSLGCMSGMFSGNVPLDASGHFTASGTWNLSIGPLRLDGNMPAQLSGQVSGRTVTVAVAVYDTTLKQVTSLGPQSAGYGKPSIGQICPV